MRYAAPLIYVSRRPIMRSAAALASAFEDVAQVRYSRSGTSEVSRRPNQDFEPTGSSASDCARLSTAPKE